ncbi:lipase/acyltransferase domain-containing protein, partial [Frankia sp. Cr2]|uniref:lipase/acyltransferase domain-containing protein n=1 Tax=Frankia sp. Cr2 TaxID=3073932 RepID=UPI003A0FF66E
MSHDVYVLIPGITGSVLEKDGRDVFGLTAEAGLRALFSAGRSIDALRLVDDPWEVDDIGDGVRATRLAADAHLVPGLWKIDGYGAVGQYLRRRLRLVPGESYFEFPYDWRRDNRVAARRLASSARRWLAARRATYPDAQLVLVAHSMGGLVARYYLEALDGWRDTRTLITFGTPYRGSLNAVGFLAIGYTKMFGLIDLTDLMRSFTSVHQLLPIYPCLDRGDGTLVRLTEAAGLVPGLDPVKVAAARRFHAEIEDAVGRHGDDDDYRTNGYRVCPVVGIEQPTDQSAVWSGDRLTVLRTYEGADFGGDGTVPRVAAFPQEADNEWNALFAPARHASLQNTDAVLTQVRGWMTSVDLKKFRAGAP